MPEIMNPQRSDDLGNDPVTARVRETRAGLATLLEEAEVARRLRDGIGPDEAGRDETGRDGTGGGAGRGETDRDDTTGRGEVARGEAGRGEVGRGEVGRGGSGLDDGTRGEDTAKAGSAVTAWNHFENIPTFYNWNNRPR
jgi:hypothetical protein